MKVQPKHLLAAGLVVLVSACATSEPDHCAVNLRGDLDSAMRTVETKLGSGCEYHFDGYFQNLLTLAEANPDKNNRRHFSDHLLRVQEMGVISRRQAEGLYNRYFNVKFVSLQGDYNTCSQTCPIRRQVMSDMKAELHDKELGLLRASSDAASFYRADHLLKETDLVLEATCRACLAGGDER
ncbi:MAG TPA: hypothetical protein VIS76_11465 [Pseudomonadales bacterium]